MNVLSTPPATRVIHNPTALTLRIVEELERQRRSGPLQQITVPPCPEQLLRLQQALDEPEPDLNTVSNIVSSDAAMAATLLRNANAALYAGDQPVRTVGGAMNRLGLDLTATLLTEVLLKQAIKADHPRLKGFWATASLRAAAMQHLAHRVPGVAPPLAQLYGLFCHVGIPVMLQRLPGYSGTMVEAHARRDRSYAETENANHRTDHAVVGALVARAWQVAPPVMAAIRLHHDLPHLRKADADGEVQTLLALGVVAEEIVCRRLALPLDSDYVQHRALALEWLQAGDEDVAGWEDELQAVFDAV
jgi:HD-like signal output (HDOD) protein